MKRTVLFVMAITCAGSAFAQTEEQKIRDRPNYQSQRPFGATGWPPKPRDPRDETNFGTPQDNGRNTNQSSKSEQKLYAERASEWRRMQYRRQHPLSVNLGGDPSFTSSVPPSYSRRSSAPSISSQGNSRSYGNSASSGSYSSGSSIYTPRAQRRSTAPSTYDQAVRQDQSWLRPNFGSAQPSRPYTNRSTSGGSSSSPYGYHPYGSSSSSSQSRCSSYQINCPRK